MDEVKFTHRQSTFIKRYVSHGNGARAAREAGYSEKTAKEMAMENLTKPHIQSKIEQLMNEKLDKMGATEEWRIKMLMECAQKCMDGAADKDGKVHPSGINSSIDILNKMGGSYNADNQRQLIHSADTTISDLIEKCKLKDF